MKNDLEKFIVDNRQEFDGLSPNPEIWNKIANKLDAKPQAKVFKLRAWMGVAAAMVVMFGSWIFFNNVQERKFEVAGIDPSYAEKKGRFVALIEEKKDSLATFVEVSPELTKQFSEDLIKLDQEYAKLQLEISTTPNRETIVKAMIRNREMQLQTLRQQLIILNQVSDFKHNNDLSL